jgi:glucose uptake protein GlcU
MDWEWIFIIGSLAFALAVIVGANMWALRDGSPAELRQRRALEKGIADLLSSESKKLR